MEFDIDKIVSEMDFHSNSLNTISKDVMLTNKEIEVLNKYKIDYKKCSNLGEILFEIETVINDEVLEEDDLEYISQSIAERNYYQNTNK